MIFSLTAKKRRRKQEERKDEKNKDRSTETDVEMNRVFVKK